MKKIYEYEGKKYERVLVEDGECTGCAFIEAEDWKCSMDETKKMLCFKSRKYYIFKELKPEEDK